MSSVESSSVVFKNVETQGQNTNFVSRHNLNAASAIQNVKGKENPIHTEDQETMELQSLAGAKEKEIQYLREQIVHATIRGSQLLNEKFGLERKYSELRMVLDEKQSEVIASASNELGRRKGDLEVNFNLLNELKVVEDEKYIFTSSMIDILAECGALPHATNASALANSIKQLHDQLQLKIKTSHVRVTEMTSIIGKNSRLGFSGREIPSSSPVNGQFSGISVNMQEYSPYNDTIDGKNFVPADGASTDSAKMQQLQNNESLLRKFPDMERNVADRNANNTLPRSGFMLESEQTNAGQFSYPPIIRDGAGSFSSKDDGPEIDDFQITGDAKPGCKLLGCGFPARGTLLCMFQWVRLYPDGTMQFIEGATNPEYLVTADDVDKIIAVECIPMDEEGRQGNLVRAFANDHNKITCDEEMQEAIDSYVSTGLARFKVQILLDTSENWEPSTLTLNRSGFQVKVHGDQDAKISDSYSEDLLIKIPSGFPPQFVLTCPNGSSYPFSTSSNIRLRDTLVLTMRIFQSKALDEKRKGKA